MSGRQILSVKAVVALSLSVLFTAAIFSPALAAPVLKQIPFSRKVPLPYPRTYTFRFSLCTSPDPGDPMGECLWWEEATIRLKSRVLKHTLGSSPPGSLDLFSFAEQYWVQVDRVKPDSSLVRLGPRTPLAAAPYAFWGESCKLPDCPVGQVLVSTGTSQWVCRLLCSGQFVDPQTNPFHCGACGISCGTGSCLAGECWCAPGCDPDWMGDGYCDADCNFSECNYDGGDCECAPGCDAEWIADGFCDAECNVPECEFDGGDCPPPP